MKDEIINKITEILKGLGVESPKVVLGYPSRLELGDLTTNVAMVHAKDIHKKPLELAEEIKSKLVEVGLPRVKVEVVAPGFINFFFDVKYFSDVVGQKTYGKLFEGKKFIFEHSQPNPFKAFHIGHLMSNNIGEATSRIIKANGAEVKVVSYNGDVGLHIAKSVWAMKNGKSLEVAYAFGNTAYETDEQAKKEIIEINKKIYNESDPEISKIYEKGREDSLKKFDELYVRLDTKFDFQFYESQTGPVGKELVEENIGKVFEKGDPVNGTSGVPIIFRGENFEPKTHTRVFVNSEGIPTYEAKELGLAQIKKDYFTYDESVTVTANEQDSFFKVVEVAIGEVLPELKGKLHHLSHGLLKLTSGKMSSRTGTVISAEDLIDQVKQKVIEKMNSRILPEQSEGQVLKIETSEIEAVAEMVALAAIRYSILRQAIGGDIIFDFDKSISFEGDSGPYLQYSAVRANSILKKIHPKSDLGLSPKSDFGVNDGPEGWQTTNLERLLERFSSVVEKAGKEYSPHHLVTYLIDLAGEFNSFYASHKIIDEVDPTSPYRLYLTKVFVGVMEDGLRLLGIKVPEKM